MSMGLGVIHTKSGKQRLNTKSSTEAELVGTSDYLPYILHFQMFMEHQGYKLEKTIIYQDNQSAIKMEKNGQNSCTGNSRHVDIRYFFVKDRVDKGEVTIEYCPTTEMLADFFTKPLQGALYHKLRNVIMGYAHISSLQSSVEERVGNSPKATDACSGKTDLNETDEDELEGNPRSYAEVVAGRKL